MKNKIYFIISLIILLVASFQTLEAYKKRQRRIGKAKPGAIFSSQQCIGIIKEDGTVSLNCGKCTVKEAVYARIAIMSPARCSGLSRKKLKKKLNKLKNRGYVCNTGTIYGYRPPATPSSIKGTIGTWYTEPKDAEDLKEGFDPEIDPASEKEVDIRYLCEQDLPDEPDLLD